MDRKRIMMDAYNSRYYFNLRSTKMYHDMKVMIWWGDMKKNITELVP